MKLNRHTALQPDVAIFKREQFFKLTDHPTADMVKLLIEVADSSYAGDRNIKLPKYAEANIAEVWIIHLQAKAIEVYSQPRQQQYLSQQTYLSDQSVPIHFSIPVIDIWGINSR